MGYYKVDGIYTTNLLPIINYYYPNEGPKSLQIMEDKAPQWAFILAAMLQETEHVKDHSAGSKAFRLFINHIEAARDYKDLGYDVSKFIIPQFKETWDMNPDAYLGWRAATWSLV
jgi:hypothetical protein